MPYAESCVQQVDSLKALLYALGCNRHLLECQGRVVLLKYLYIHLVRVDQSQADLTLDGHELVYEWASLFAHLQKNFKNFVLRTMYRVSF